MKWTLLHDNKINFYYLFIFFFVYCYLIVEIVLKKYIYMLVVEYAEYLYIYTRVK